MIPEQQRAELEDVGFTYLRGAFTADEAAAMRRVVWEELDDKYGMHEHDRTTWIVERPSGLRRSKRHPAFESIGGEVTSGAVDALLGRGRWHAPRNWGNVLVTFPSTSQEWVVPHGLWHVDFGYHESVASGLFALKIFAFFADAPSRSGGTLVIARSHQLVVRFVEGQDLESRANVRTMRLRFMSSHPWLKALASPDYEDDRTERFMDADGDVGGIAARVVELTGEPGDIVIAHPWLVHHVAYHTGSYPRMMRAKSIHRMAHPDRATI